MLKSNNIKRQQAYRELLVLLASSAVRDKTD